MNVPSNVISVQICLVYLINMCILFLYTCSNPRNGGYKLILASNRDEFYARKTRSAVSWPSAEHVFGGIDLEPGREGGTWLAVGGLNEQFRVGALLNLTGEPQMLNPMGRGAIVSDFVTSPKQSYIGEYTQNLMSDSTKYSAFNFVAIEIGNRLRPAEVVVCSNAPPTITLCEDGQCYGFGNSLPDNAFQKVLYGQVKFQLIVNNFLQTTKNNKTLADVTKNETELVDNLLSLLKCRKKLWPDKELERRAPNWGEDLSSLNVIMPNKGYGSRTHTIILIDGNNELFFFEETMDGPNAEGNWLKSQFRKQYFKDELY